jgi:hypothetical protein
LPAHPLLDAILGEFDGGKLAAAITPEHAQLPPCLCFHGLLELLDRHRCLILGAQRAQPHVAVVVVDEEKIAVAAWCRRRDGTTQVSVYQFQDLIRPVLCSMWERRPAMLASQATAANLVHLLHLR